MRVIITGATGMVGEGVLSECIRDARVQEILVIGRRSCNVAHAKVKELLVEDFSDFSAVEDQLKGYDAAYLCMGVSSVGLNEAQYTLLTYDLTMALAKPLEKMNADMTICYVTGMGTDSTEQGRSMWARVKGKTENDLMKMSFAQAFMFRPGGMQPEKGARNIKGVFKPLILLMPLFRMLFPGSMHTIKELAQAMLHVTEHGHEKQILEVKDIVRIAQLNQQ